MMYQHRPCRMSVTFDNPLSTCTGSPTVLGVVKGRALIHAPQGFHPLTTPARRGRRRLSERRARPNRFDHASDGSNKGLLFFLTRKLSDKAG